MRGRDLKLGTAAGIVMVASLGLCVAEGAELTVAEPSGEPVSWTTWVGAKAPVAVVLWASWAPGADATVDGLGELASAARERGLGLVLVSVQEDLAEARQALRDVAVPWLHDRHGSLLKHYRVVRIPTVLVIAEGDRVVAQLEPSPQAIAVWKGE